MNFVPGDGISRDDRFIVANCKHSIAIEKRILAWEERVVPRGDSSKTLAKSHIVRKKFTGLEAKVDLLLVIVPDCPEKGPLLNWIWMVEMIRN